MTAHTVSWDPRGPDLPGDTEAWERLLSMAYGLDGQECAGLFGALDGLPHAGPLSDLRSRLAVEK